MGTQLVLCSLRSRCQDAFREVGTGGSPIFVNVDYASGKQLNNWMDSLSASFAGLQVRGGGGVHVRGREGAYRGSEGAYM